MHRELNACGFSSETIAAEYETDAALADAVTAVLCPGCWASLPAAARRALNRRDARAMARLRELHTQLAASVPLDQIQVTP